MLRRSFVSAARVGRAISPQPGRQLGLLAPITPTFPPSSSFALSSRGGGRIAAFHTSAPRRGLEEFFIGYDQDDVGRSWKAVELRLKSNEDLRKLWFVLLKERNMLLTYRKACQQRRVRMRNPHRLFKVRLSMARIKTVLTERSIRRKFHHSPRFRAMYSNKLEQRRLARLKKPKRRPLRRAVLQWKQYKPNHPMFRTIALKRMIVIREYMQARKDVAEGVRREVPHRLKERLRIVGLRHLWRPAPQTWRHSKPKGFVPEYIKQARERQMAEMTLEEREEYERTVDVEQDLKADLKSAPESMTPEEAAAYDAELNTELETVRRGLLLAKQQNAKEAKKEAWPGEHRAYKAVYGEDFDLEQARKENLKKRKQGEVVETASRV